MTTKDEALQMALVAPFEAWWEKYGQFLRAGGGQYEKTFAWHAWCEASKPAQQQEPVAWNEPTPDFYITALSRNTIKYTNAVWGKQDFSKEKRDECVVPVWFASPPQRKPLTDDAKAVIDAARAAMDDSVEAYDSAGSIKISSHLAASLSLCLDEYDRAIEAAHGIKERV